MEKKNPDINYDKAMKFLAEEELRLINSSIISKIKQCLSNLKGTDLLVLSIRNIADSSPHKAAEFVLSCHKDNPLLVDNMIGKDCVDWIYEYFEQEKSKSVVNQQELEDLYRNDDSPESRYHK